MTERPLLYGRAAPNGGRYHIVGVLEPHHAESLCGKTLIGEVTEGEGLDFENSEFVSLCRTCKRERARLDEIAASRKTCTVCGGGVTTINTVSAMSGAEVYTHLHEEDWVDHPHNVVVSE